MQKRMNWFSGLLMLGLICCLPKLSFATSTTNLLITDSGNQRVIEVDPITHNVVWQYGQPGVYGSGTNQLSYPLEAVKLTNGNVLIADAGNYRVIEVQPTGISGGTIVWEYSTNQVGTISDVRKLDNGNILITGYADKVREIQPTGAIGGNIVWQYDDLGAWEAERLNDGSTLITLPSHNQVIRVAGSPSTTIWSYGQYDVRGSGTNQLDDPMDATQLPNGNILITERYNHRVIEVQPVGTSGGNIVWQYGQTRVSGTHTNQLSEPEESIRLSNGNTLIVDTQNSRVIEVKTTDYPAWTAASIVWQQGQTGIFGSGWNQLEWPCDVEEIWQGVLNQVIVEYKDMGDMPQPVVTAWVFTPVIPPVVYPPVLEVTKTVDPSGTQSSGTVLTYTIAYTNTGQGTATDAVFTDMVPAGTTYATGTAVIATGPAGTIQCSHDGGASYDASDFAPVTHIRWRIPAIGPSQSGTLRFSVKIN
ncbi:MAG: hypothetical protein AB1414_06920 [bacterium]